jgi:hypothetical protein
MDKAEQEARAAAVISPAHQRLPPSMGFGSNFAFGLGGLEEATTQVWRPFSERYELGLIRFFWPRAKSAR